MADPFPTCYLNGEYLPLAEARISPLDRGFLYGDGAYEAMPVYGGRPFRLEAHCARLARSLGEIRMRDPHSRTQWCDIFANLIERNGGGNLYIYWQVTRGAERGRNHAPLPDIPRTVFAFCAPLPAVAPAMFEKGLSCVTAEDTRWARCDIKALTLLANVLLRQLAVDADAAETILLRNGEVMEATASTVYVVIDGELRAPPNSRRILPGTTRGAVEELAARIGVRYRATVISEAELRGAEEIWLSAATREVQPVTTLDGKPVGTGRPGALWRRVYDEFQHWKQELQHQPWR